MKFSVLIPVHNVENYLEECLKSVFNQTYKNFEIILVDDGSTDKSPEICDCYRKKYPGIVKVIHQKNMGLLAARRVGISLADSDYCFFLDSDDTIDEKTIEKINAVVAHDNDIDVVLYNLCYVNNKSVRYPKSRFEDMKIWDSLNKNELYENLLFSTGVTSLCTKSVRTSLLQQDPTDYSIYYGKNMAEDFLQSLYILDAAQRIIYIDSYLYLYRYNQDSISRNVSPDSLKSKESLHVYHKALYYLSKWGLNNEDNVYRLNARWFNDTMYLFCKYCERVKTYRDIKNIVLLKWDSLLPEECLSGRNNYENRTYQKIHGWIKSSNTLKIYIFFIKKQIYTIIKKIRRNK